MTRAGVQVVLAGKDCDLQLAGPSHILHNHCDFEILVWITAIAQFEALRAVTRAGRNHFWDQKLPANPLLSLLKGDSECGAGKVGGSKSALEIPDNSRLCSRDSIGMSGLGLKWADLCAQGEMRQEELPLLPSPSPSSLLEATCCPEDSPMCEVPSSFLLCSACTKTCSTCKLTT